MIDLNNILKLYSKTNVQVHVYTQNYQNADTVTGRKIGISSTSWHNYHELYHIHHIYLKSFKILSNTVSDYKYVLPIIPTDRYRKHLCLHNKDEITWCVSSNNCRFCSRLSVAAGGIHETTVNVPPIKIQIRCSLQFNTTVLKRNGKRLKFMSKVV